MQVDDDAEDDVGENDGERQRDEESDGVGNVDVVIHQGADDQKQQNVARVGHAPRQGESEEQHRGIGPQRAEKALDLEGNRRAHGDGDEQQYQRNGRGFLQVDGERVDAENEERAQDSRSQPGVPLHESVDGEWKEADRGRAREAVQDPPAVGGEGILSGFGWPWPFHRASRGSQAVTSFPSYYKKNRL